MNKEPGRSHEVELRIVGLPALETLLNQAQATVQQELIRVRELQRDALKKTEPAEKQLRNTGKLRPEDQEAILQAEQLQQQIRARVGTKQEGLRAEVGRILQALRDNKSPASGARERMEMVAAELDRLAREDLEQVEPLLTNARKENDLADPKKQTDPKAKGSLRQAVGHQEEVEKTLTELLNRLEPWSTAREVRGEARNILQEQKQLNTKTDNLGKQVPPGQKPDQLEPDQKANLEQAAEAQDRQADRTRQLIDKMERVGQDKARQADDKDARPRTRTGRPRTRKPPPPSPRNRTRPATCGTRPATCATRPPATRRTPRPCRKRPRPLQEAAQRGREGTPDRQMQQAAENIKQNQLGEAGKQQKGAARSLERIVQALEDRREAELDRLVKKLKEAEDKMADLAEHRTSCARRSRRPRKSPIRKNARRSFNGWPASRNNSRRKSAKWPGN